MCDITEELGSNLVMSCFDAQINRDEINTKSEKVSDKPQQEYLITKDYPTMLCALIAKNVIYHELSCSHRPVSVTSV